MANLCVGSDIQHKDLNFWTKSMFRPTLLSDWYKIADGAPLCEIENIQQ